MNRRLLMTPELLAAKKAEMLTDTAYEGRWRSLKRVADGNAMTETSREWLPTLAAMSLLTDDPKYAARAQVILASVDATGNVLIAADRGKPVGQEVFQLALCYDWIGDRISTGLAERAALTLRVWGNWIWPETNPTRAGAWGVENPADNYYWEFLRGSWLAGLALGDDALIALSRQKWQRGLAWLKEHQPAGFFCEGTNYGIGSLVSILEAVCANKTTTGVVLPNWISSALEAVMQLTTPGMGCKAPFGDQASDYKAVHSDTDRLAVMLIATFGDFPVTGRAWLDRISRSRSKRAQSLWAEFLYYPSGANASAYSVMDFYTDPAAGYLSTRSGPEKDAVQVQAVCGPTFSNHQDAAGTFVVCRGNDWLVGHAKQWGASGLQHGAEFVNCITVDGRGQDNMLDKTARVLKSEDNPRYTLWQCEAGQAYDFSVTSSQRIKPLKGWRRTLVFLKPGTLIVHDRVEKNDPKSVVALHLNTKQDPFQGAVIAGSSEVYIAGLLPTGGQTVDETPLALGPKGADGQPAISSYRWDIAPAGGQPVDEFLIAFQAGPAGFTPMPVTKTKIGVRVGDDEVIFNADGTVEFVDHRVSPRDAALHDLFFAVAQWDRLGEEDKVPQVIAAAKALIAVTG